MTAVMEVFRTEVVALFAVCSDPRTSPLFVSNLCKGSRPPFCFAAEHIQDRSRHFKVVAARQPVTCTHPSRIFGLHFDTPQLGPQGCLRRLERQQHHALRLGVALPSCKRADSSFGCSTIRRGNRLCSRTISPTCSCLSCSPCLHLGTF